MPQRLLHEKFGKANLVGRRLRKIRENAGVSHVQMLGRLHKAGWDIDPAVLSRIEQGRRTITDIEMFTLLTVLGVDWAALNE